MHPERLLPRLVGEGDEGLHHHPLLTLDQGQHWSCYRRATDGVRNTVGEATDAVKSVRNTQKRL